MYVLATWIWISRHIGREALATSLTHIEHVVKVVKALKEMNKAIISGEIDKAYRLYDTIYHEEEVADEKKREIIKTLSKGVLHPIDRDDILRLVLTSDDIAAYAKAAARRLKVVLESSLEIPGEVLKVLDVMISMSVEAVEILENAIKSLITDPKKSLKDADKIEEIEEKVDDLKMKAYLKAIEYGKNKWNISSIFVKEIIDNIEMITDKCEDTGDVIRAIALMRM